MGPGHIVIGKCPSQVGLRALWVLLVLRVYLVIQVRDGPVIAGGLVIQGIQHQVIPDILVHRGIVDIVRSEHPGIQDIVRFQVIVDLVGILVYLDTADIPHLGFQVIVGTLLFQDIQDIVHKVGIPDIAV
jgi:hypothetical protein